jgi:hypothetical protein
LQIAIKKQFDWEGETDLKKGNRITAIHNKSGLILNYLIVEDQDTHKYRLVNTGSGNIMGNFQTDSLDDVYTYLEKTVKCEILEIR